MLLGFSRTYLPEPHPPWEPVYNDRRFHHTWVVGKTGQGKSTFLTNTAIEDILNGDGIAFFDPHGDAIERIMKYVPHEKVILFDPSDTEYPIGINPLYNVQDFPFVASSIVDTFHSLWGNSWGPQLEQYLYNGLAALAEVPDGSLFGLKYLITSEKYRHRVLSYVTDPVIKDFWTTDFEDVMPDREKRQNTLSTLNKIGALISDPKLRNILGQPKSTLDISKVMEEGKSILFKLPQGELGIKKASLLGSLLMSQIHLSALRRKSRLPFHVFADEAHHFGTETLEEMASGIRKYQVSLCIAHQYMDQLPPSLQSALLGTVGTTVSFRLGVGDSEILTKEMRTKTTKLDPKDLITLSPYTMWAKTGDDLHRLSADEGDFEEVPNGPQRTINSTRSQYGRSRIKVERKLNKFMRHT